MPKLNIDKSQICPENHKALIIHAGFLLGFPSFLKSPVSVAGSVRGGTNMRLEAPFNAKKKRKKMKLGISCNHVAPEDGELNITIIFRG